MPPSTAKAKELGCQDAVIFPNGGFLGYKHIKEMQAADKVKAFPDFLIKRQDDMSELTGRVCSTFRNDVLGQTMYFTSDPKNIQAMLATQFEDYDLRQAVVHTIGNPFVRLGQS